jgi:hypothetical protein
VKSPSKEPSSLPKGVFKGQRTKQRKKQFEVETREMDLDDLAHLFHPGERLFTSKKVPHALL